jgi:cytochrome c oxidase assembly protein subunit 15
MSDAASDARLRSTFARLAIAAVALTLVVVVASAFLRHTQAGLGCGDWPSCYARIAADAVVAPSEGVVYARLAHRVSATGVLVLVVGMLLVAWTQKPAWKREGALAAAALLLALALAALGVVTPGARLPAVVLGNLLGGFLILAVLASLAAASSPGMPGPAGTVPFARLALALVLVEAALGATIGAQYALTACPTIGSCPDPAPGGTVGAFDILRPLVIEGGRVVPPADAATLHTVHRWLSIAATLATLGLAFALRKERPRTAFALGGLALVVPLLGAEAVVTMPSLATTVAHNAAAALLVAALAGASARRPAAP